MSKRQKSITISDGVYNLAIEFSKSEKRTFSNLVEVALDAYMRDQYLTKIQETKYESETKALIDEAGLKALVEGEKLSIENQGHLLYCLWNEGMSSEVGRAFDDKLSTYIHMTYHVYFEEWDRANYELDEVESMLAKYKGQ